MCLKTAESPRARSIAGVLEQGNAFGPLEVLDDEAGIFVIGIFKALQWDRPQIEFKDFTTKDAEDTKENKQRAALLVRDLFEKLQIHLPKIQNHGIFNHLLRKDAPMAKFENKTLSGQSRRNIWLSCYGASLRSH